MRACDSGSSAVVYISTPMRRTRSGCCARAASGHCRRAAERRDEIAPSHWITSSARTSMRAAPQAERLGGLEVDGRFVLGRRLHRQFAGRGTAAGWR